MPEDTFQKQVESQHCPTKVAVRFMKVETCQKHSDLEQGELIMIPNSNIYEMGQVSQLYVVAKFLANDELTHTQTKQPRSPFKIFY